jgi:hypothetical protein
MSFNDATAAFLFVDTFFCGEPSLINKLMSQTFKVSPYFTEKAGPDCGLLDCRKKIIA